ncbi:MAG: hypothetical protein OT477_19560 [Chloroflexi bacterium]|nr:hypothetical protein [Chloroflexota bacterium]
MTSHLLNWETEDEYEAMAERYIKNGRAQKLSRAQQAQRQAVMATLADESEQTADFHPTYLRNFDPKHHEYTWLLESLGGFYHDKVLDDILRMVKGGKEANVYVCTGTPAAGHELIAAKVYRPRMLRSLSNDAIYKEGRSAKDEAGQEIRGGRLRRALLKKTTFGQKVDFATWITHEYQVQTALHEAGAAVPKPLAQRGNTILMSYLGDKHTAAPTLHDIRLPAASAPPLFDEIMRNIELFLAHHTVHGDLSPYNILYWQGEVTLIDFPQMVDARINPHAFKLLQRDIQRVVDYFAPLGLRDRAPDLAADLWERYMGGELGE